MSESGRPRGGTAVGNALVVLSMLSVGAALLYPRMRMARFEERVAGVVAAVELARTSALRHFAETDAWPADAEPGVVPPELSDDVPSPGGFVQEAATLDWNRWQAVYLPEPLPPPEDRPLVDDEVEAEPAPPPAPEFTYRASLSVHSADEGLLAALLARYGPSMSFVRDTTWTLVLPGSAPAG